MEYQAKTKVFFFLLNQAPVLPELPPHRLQAQRPEELVGLLEHCLLAPLLLPHRRRDVGRRVAGIGVDCGPQVCPGLAPHAA